MEESVMGRRRSVFIGLTTLALVLGSGETVSAGSGSLDDLAATVAETTQDATGTVAETTQDATDTVAETTQEVVEGASQTEHDVTEAVSETSHEISDATSGTAEDIVGTASRTADDGSAVEGHATDGVMDPAIQTDGIAASAPGAAKTSAAGDVQVVSRENVTGWRAGSSPYGDGPLVGRRSFAPASLALAVGSAAEAVSAGALPAGGCGRFHRGGQPVPCPDGEGQGDGVLGIVLASTGIAVLCLLAWAAALAASGTTSLAAGRIRGSVSKAPVA